MPLSPEAQAILARAAARPDTEARPSGISGPGVSFIPAKETTDIEHTGVQTAHTKGKEAREAETFTEKKQAARDAAIAKRHQSYELISSALPLLEKIQRLAPAAAGFGSETKAKYATTSDAAELKAAIDQLRSINFKVVVDDMKVGSPTGSTGIGRILQSEVPLIENKLAVLRQSRNPKALASAAADMGNAVRKIYAGSVGRADDLYNPKTRRKTMAEFGITEQGQKQGAPLPAPGGFAYEGPNDKRALLASGAGEKSEPIKPEYQREFSEYVTSHLGQLDPQDYAAKRAELDKKYGYGVGDPKVYAREAAGLNRDYAAGNAVNLAISPINLGATEFEKKRAALENIPGAGFAIGTLAGAAGQVAKPFMNADTVAKLELLKEAHPTASTIGAMGSDIGMSVLGARAGLPTGVINAYQGASANYDPNDPLGSAATGGLTGLALGKAGELVGHGLAGVGRKVGAVPINAITREGVPMTIGELGGGFGKKAEDLLARVPIAGAALRQRQAEGARAVEDVVLRGQQEHQQALEELARKYNVDVNDLATLQRGELAGLKSKYAASEAQQREADLAAQRALGEEHIAETRALPSRIAREQAALSGTHAALTTAATEDMNREALQKVLDNIGGSASGRIGHAGVDEAQLAVSNAYRDALAGINVPVTDEFKAAMANAVKDLSAETKKGAKALAERLEPFQKADVLNGEDYQRLMRTMGELRNSYTGPLGTKVGYYTLNNVTRGVEDAAHDMVGAVAPEVRSALDAANAARRDLGVVEGATAKSVKNGGVFDADTLLNSATDRALKFGSEAKLAGKGPEVPFVGFAKEARDNAIRRQQELGLQTAEQAATHTLLGQSASDAQRIARQQQADAARAAAAERKAAHEAEREGLVASHAEQRGAADIAHAENIAAQKAAQAEGEAAFRGEVAAAKNEPRTVSHGANTMAAFGVPLAIAGDVALEPLLKDGEPHAGDTGDTAMRDLTLAALALAPNLLYSKHGQKLLSKGVLPKDILGREALQKYLPAVLGGGAVGAYGGAPKDLVIPDELRGAFAPLPLPTEVNLRPQMFDAVPEQAAPEVEQDVANKARGGAVRKTPVTAADLKKRYGAALARKRK